MCWLDEKGDVSRVTHFFDHTALKPKVRLETMAEMKPVQLNVRSEADASATPACNRVKGEGPF